MTVLGKKGFGVIITIFLLLLYPQCLKLLFNMHYETPAINRLLIWNEYNEAWFFFQGEHTSSREEVSGNWTTSEWEQKTRIKFLRLHSGWIAQTMTRTIIRVSQNIRKSGKTRKRLLSRQAQPCLLLMCSHWFYYCYTIYY